jgi:hypothetical protein
VIKLEFKSWLLKEVGTSTASVAVFARPIFSEPVKRTSFFLKDIKKKNIK